MSAVINLLKFAALVLCTTAFVLVVRTSYLVHRSTKYEPNVSMLIWYIAKNRNTRRGRLAARWSSRAAV